MSAPRASDLTTGTLAEWILEEVRQERERCPEMDLPDDTGNWRQLAAANNAAVFRRRAAEAGGLTWSTVLGTQACEALAEARPERLRAELLKVAAVAVQWVEALDRRRPLQ